MDILQPTLARAERRPLTSMARDLTTCQGFTGRRGPTRIARRRGSRPEWRNLAFVEKACASLMLS